MADLEQEAQAGESIFANDDFANLLQKEFRPKSDTAKTAVEEAVKTLAEQALANTALVSDDALKTIEGIIAEIDKTLTAQVNEILHNEEFQKLESAWRGLSYLVNNTETDEQLKIRVLNISKKDLSKTMRKFKGTAWDQSPIFKKLYEEEYGQFGGEPYGCLVGDYHFDHSPPDVELLGEMSKVAAASHAPFITGGSPSLMQMDSWNELANPRDLTKIFSTPEYAAWRSLRESQDSQYLALAMPRFLGRHPYGAKTDPVEEFAFEEDTEGETQDAAMADKGAFELISFSFGAENNINMGSSSGGGGAGKATFKEFSITKKTDLGSPGLFQQLCVGRHFDEAVVELRRSGGSTTESGATFMKFHFKHVMVQDIEWSGSDGDDICEESVTLQYGAMKVEYIPQKADGSMDTAKAKKAEWSRIKNTAQYAV